MFNIDNNGIISVSRGDSFSIPLFINQGTDLCPSRYTLTENDALYLALMECNQPFECAIVKQKYTKDNLNENNDVLINFTPKDTVGLAPGKYYYTIKLKTNYSDGTFGVNTIIPNTKFFIEE